VKRAATAVAALVATDVEAVVPSPVGRREAHLEPAPADSLLLDALEEVIFTLDTAEGAVAARRRAPRPTTGVSTCRDAGRS